MSTPLRVTHVALTSTPDARAAGRPELTPELLSATGQLDEDEIADKEAGEEDKEDAIDSL